MTTSSISRSCAPAQAQSIAASSCFRKHAKSSRARSTATPRSAWTTAANADWGINLQLPYIDRTHQTIAEGDTAVSSSRSSGIDDMRALARYQGFSPQHDVGIEIGLKLPTGRHDESFARGPQAGQALDRGLQLGSGTTDLLLGVYKFSAINQDFDWFAQGIAQIALDSRDDYRTGASLNLKAGLRYMANPAFTPQLQINARVSRRDTGIKADMDNSGGALIDLSPGITA